MNNFALILAGAFVAGLLIGDMSGFVEGVNVGVDAGYSAAKS